MPEQLPVRRLARTLSRPGITPRMAEVLSRPRLPALLLELLAEKPRGACAVCWRDTRPKYAGQDPLTCRRTLPGSTSSPCNRFVLSLQARASAGREAAKVALHG